MKKMLFIAAAVFLLLTASGCGTKADVDADTSAANGNTIAAEENNSDTAAGEGAEAPADTQASDSPEETAWPELYEAWGIPKPDSAKVVSVEDRSIENGVITQGVNIIVNLDGVTKQAFDDYCTNLEKEGFEKDPDSLADVMLVFYKAFSGGSIELTLSYTDSGVTIVANNSAAAAQKDEQTAGSANWPESVSGIPEFTRGNYKETVDMGGGMYAVTYTGVTETDLDWYRNALISAGFVSQEGEDTEGYARFDEDKAYSVGFYLEGDTLQVIVLSGSF